MKKIFIGLAVVAALMFCVAPSQALNSIDDNVPGVNPLLPFFLVDKAGYDNNSGLDTLFVIQEIGGQTEDAKHGEPKGGLHIVVRDKKSNDVGSKFDTYTPDDVVAYTARDLIRSCVGKGKLSSLELVLNGKTYYSGYVNVYNQLKEDDNLVAFMYVIDLANGWAAANTAPVFEYANEALGHTVQQIQEISDTKGGYGEYTLEPYSPNGYAVSEFRERNEIIPDEDASASSFRLLPRWYLKDANAETYIPVWTSDNHTGLSVTGLIYDNAENVRDLPIDLPYELNWIDLRELLVSDWQTKTGGWIDIELASDDAADIYDDSWLAYSYQTASSASVGANWSVLHGVHREVGTLPQAD